MRTEGTHIARERPPAHRRERALQRARRAPARPLAADIAADLGGRFGHDFSRVRVRADSDAARDLQADAFTIGQEIFFAPGRFDPHSPAGRELLAHELAHTIQHGDRPGFDDAFRLSRPGDALEVQADAAARAAMADSGLHVLTTPASSPLAAGIVSRKMASPAVTPQVLAIDSPEETYQGRTDAILEGLHTDPTDRSGRLRRQLKRLAPDTREELLARVREKVTDAEWARLSEALEESLPSEAEQDTTTAPPPETSEEAAPDREGETERPKEPASVEGAEAVASAAAVEEEAPAEPGAAPSPEESLEKDPGPEGPPKPFELDAERVEEAAEERGPEPEEVPEAEGPLGKGAVAAAGGAAPAAPTAEAAGGEEAAGEAGAAVAEPETAGPEGGEREAAGEEAAGSEGTIAAETQATEREEEAEAEEEADSSGGPEALAAEGGRATTGEETATEDVPAGEVVAPSAAVATGPMVGAEPIGDEATEAADVSMDAPAEPATDLEPPAELIEAEEPPSVPPSPTPAGPVAAEAPAPPAIERAVAGMDTTDTAGGPVSGESAASISIDAHDTATGAPPEIDAIGAETPDAEAVAGPEPAALDASPSDIGGEAAAAGPEAGACAADAGAAPSAEAGGGDGGGGACGGGGGGGGAAAEEPSAAAAPDVSQSDPSQAMGAIKGLPPVQMQQALGGVSEAATNAVSDQREELSANPPQMERPSGVPAQRDPETPVGPVPPANTAGAGDVERTPEGEALAVPQPDPLPAPPANPTEGLPGPRVPGDAEMSEADVAKAQGAIRDLPTTDPALDVTAGDPPTLELAGDADPALVTDQRAKVDQGTTDARAQGQQDAAEPLGENNIYPTVPQETLKAETGGEGLGVGGTLAACAKGGGKALKEAQSKAGGGASDAEAVSIIAKEEKGAEIDSAVEEAQGDMVAKQEEHATKVADEKTKSQEEIDGLIEENAAKQKDERTDARAESIELRTEWDGEQRTIVDKGRKGAAKAAEDAAGTIETEQREGNKKAAGEIEKGDKEAADARRDAERKAAEEKKKGEKESSGFFGWLGSKVSRFFNAIKEAIQSAFEFARTLVKKAIEAAKKLAVEAIELARKAVVGAIKLAGDALIAVGDVVLAGFPEARDRFRKGVQDRVDRAVDTVNELADDLKEGVQKLLDALGDAINGLLGLLECAYLAAVDVVAGVVQAAIDFANKFIQLVGQFAALIKDVASDPIGWIKKLGSAVVDGIRNCLWGSFKSAVRNWFNSKLEEVLGLGPPIWKLLFKGCLKMADIGKMAWQALLTAIPIALIQLLIEKLVSMIVPAAGAILTIIEGLRAAWGTVSRIITAFALFFAFLKAVKGGNAAGAFAAALAAAAVVVIDFVANWLLVRLAKAARAIAGKLKALAQKIGAGLKAGARAAKRGFTVAAGAVRRGAQAVGRSARRGAQAVGRGVRRGAAAVGTRVRRGAAAVGRGARRAGQAVARTKPGRQLARAANAVRAAAVRGKRALQRAKDRYKAWRERRRQQKKQREEARRRRAFEAARNALNRRLRRGSSFRAVRALALWLKLRHRFRTMRVQGGQEDLDIDAGFSPLERLSEARRMELEAAKTKARSAHANVHTVVGVRLLTFAEETLGELMDDAQKIALRNHIEQGLRESNRPHTPADVSVIANRILQARITVVSGTKELRTLYASLYQKAFGEAQGEIHHLIPLYLGGSHEQENLLDLGEALHKKVHALFRQIGTERGFSLSPNTLRARYKTSDRWALAIIFKDGRILYEEIVFVAA